MEKAVGGNGGCVDGRERILKSGYNTTLISLTHSLTYQLRNHDRDNGGHYFFFTLLLNVSTNVFNYSINQQSN